MTIETRDDAVSYLLSKGLLASKRDWAMGETISLARRRVEAAPGILVLEAHVYIYLEDGRWWLWTDRRLDPGFASLAEAVLAAEAHVGAQADG